MRFILILFFIFSLESCKEKVSTQNFIDQLFDTIANNSIYKDSIDFESEISVKNEFVESKNNDSIYAVIKKLFTEIGDNHSHFYSPEQAKNWKSTSNKKVNFTTKLINKEYGYIFIPQFISGNIRTNKKYAHQLQNQIYSLNEKNNIKGWIIDLRLNSGGNCWPMITGLGSLIRHDTLGYFFDSNQEKHLISYKNGTSYLDESEQLKIENPKILKGDKCPIIILVSPKTSSSGELIAILLKGIPNIKILGQKTSGLTTGNQTFRFENGSILFLSTSHFMDKYGNLYTGGIKPDYSYSYYSMNLKNLEKDQLIYSAIYWINRQI